MVRRKLLLIFFTAIAIRWLYCIVLFLAKGNDGLFGPDSRGNYPLMQEFALNAASGAISGWQWLGPDLALMPMIFWLGALNVLLFGKWAALGYVLMQGLVDAGTCLLVAGIAKTMDVRYTTPVAIVASFNPTQIVMSGLIYNDTVFTFFVALFLLGSVRWLRAPSWKSASIIGIGLGMAALTRILIAPWVPFLLMFLLMAAFIRARTILRYVLQLGLAGAIFGLCVGIILVRNVTQFDGWSLSPQTGSYYAFWIAPLVRQAKDGTPWAQGAADMQRRAHDSIQADNPFERSKSLTKIGQEAIGEYGLDALIKAWMFGAAINLVSPGVILSPPVMELPRTGFYATSGSSLSAKIANFLFASDNALYSWILLLGIAGMLAIRFVQIVGLAALAKRTQDWPVVLLLVSWIGFILAIHGPIASPKYRLPLEPSLTLLAGVGFVVLRDWKKSSVKNDDFKQI